MTNNQLHTIFQTAESGADNIFDVYDFLNDYAEEYQEMPIAKVKPTIYDAYELYCSHKNKGLEILNAILKADYSAIIDQFDLEKLFNNIPEQYQGVIAQLLEEYDIHN